MMTNPKGTSPIRTSGATNENSKGQKARSVNNPLREYERLEFDTTLEAQAEAASHTPTEPKEFWKPNRPYLHVIGALVNDHGYQVATFLHSLNAATADKKRRFKVAYEYQTAEVYAAHMWMSTRQFYKLAKKVSATGYATCKRAFRAGYQCLEFTVSDDRLRKLVAAEIEASDRMYPYYYHAGLAQFVSIDAAILYAVIRAHTAEDVIRLEQHSGRLKVYDYVGSIISPAATLKHFPWMSERDVRRALSDLTQIGLIVREENRQNAYSRFVYKVQLKDASLTMDQIAARLAFEQKKGSKWPFSPL
jgi:hypothetical protein